MRQQSAVLYGSIKNGNEVLDADEQGVSGYQLRLFEGTGDTAQAEVFAQRESGAQGRYDFGPVAPQTAYTVEVRDGNDNLIRRFAVTPEQTTAGSTVELALPIDPIGCDLR